MFNVSYILFDFTKAGGAGGQFPAAGGPGSQLPGAGGVGGQFHYLFSHYFRLITSSNY